MQASPTGSHGIVYVRVSTEHQASDELPIASQIAELTAAVERAGATCGVIQDAGISGTDVEGRQGLQTIAARVREPHPTFAWSSCGSSDASLATWRKGSSTGRSCASV